MLHVRRLRHKWLLLGLADARDRLVVDVQIRRQIGAAAWLEGFRADAWWFLRLFRWWLWRLFRRLRCCRRRGRWWRLRCRLLWRGWRRRWRRWRRSCLIRPVCHERRCRRRQRRRSREGRRRRWGRRRSCPKCPGRSRSRRSPKRWRRRRCGRRQRRRVGESAQLGQRSGFRHGGGGKLRRLRGLGRLFDRRAATAADFVAGR